MLGVEIEKDPSAKGPTVFVKVSNSFIQILNSEAMDRQLMFEPEKQDEARGTLHSVHGLPLIVGTVTSIT